MRLRLLLVAAYLPIYTFSYSQILNVERFRLDKDTARIWLGNAGLGFAIKKQQNNIYTLNSSLNAVYLSDKHSYMSLNYIKFIRQEATNLLSEGYAHGRVNFYRRKKLSYEPFLQYQYDVGRGLVWRELYGFSFRYTIFAKEKSIFAINTGAMYEHEIWEGNVLRFLMDGTANRAETFFLKSTSNVSFRFNISQNIFLFLVSYYQARFDRFFAPRVISDIQLQFKVSRILSFNTQFTSTYDALPPVEGNSFVYSLNNSIVINFINN